MIEINWQGAKDLMAFTEAEVGDEVSVAGSKEPVTEINEDEGTVTVPSGTYRFNEVDWD